MAQAKTNEITPQMYKIFLLGERLRNAQSIKTKMNERSISSSTSNRSSLIFTYLSEFAL
jgi:hypothetical protein